MRNQLRNSAIRQTKSFEKFISNATNTATLNIAKNNWTNYTPRPSQKKVAGIDSSRNTANLSVLPLSAVQVVCMTKNGDCIFEKSTIGFDQNPDQVSLILECNAITESVQKSVDLTLTDGSLYSAASIPSIWEMHTNHMSELLDAKVVFVSKSSLSKLSLQGPLTDGFYYSNATTSPGFSIPTIDKTYSKTKAITSTFVRLSENTPILKIEFLGEQTEDQIKSTMDDMSDVVVGGYPYEFVLAHQQCLIQKADMDELLSIFGLSAQERAREVLS